MNGRLTIKERLQHEKNGIGIIHGYCFAGY